jgi:hypothetical protein
MVYTDGVHLVADTLDELHAFAESIGMKRSWFQDHPRHPHYDTISKGKKSKAIKAGAILISSKEIVMHFRKLGYL